MERKHFIIFLAFFLAAAAAFAAEIIITPSGPVQAGTVLHFSAIIEDWMGKCTITPGQYGPLYVGNKTNSWKTEGIVPVPNSGSQTYNFQATYTVTDADMKDPDFCFYLCHGAMGCWAQGQVFAQKCPPKQQLLTLTSPNGGETWPSGLVRDVTWNANWKGMVQVNLFQNKVFKGVIARGVPATKGTLPWQVGATDRGAFAGKGFRVVIVRQAQFLVKTPSQRPLADESDGAFTILPPKSLHR